MPFKSKLEAGAIYAALVLMAANFHLTNISIENICILLLFIKKNTFLEASGVLTVIIISEQPAEFVQLQYANHHCGSDENKYIVPAK